MTTWASPEESTGPQVASRPRRDLAQREIAESVRQVLRLTCARDQLQVANALTDRHLKLVGEDHSSKGDPFPLAARRFGEEVDVSREEDTPQGTGSIEQLVVGELSCVVPLGGQDIRAGTRSASVIASGTWTSM